jgi:ribonucleotide reductase alpha subunit
LGKKEISVEEIRNVVEPLIAKAGYFATAKHYILFSHKPQATRDKRIALTEPQMTEVGLEVMKKRYLKTDLNGKVVETPGEMFWRVARHMAKAEVQFNSRDEEGKPLNGMAMNYWAERFFERMVNFKYVCAGKAMFEAGNQGGTGQLSSCFVLPIEDNIGAIFKPWGTRRWCIRITEGRGLILVPLGLMEIR